MQTNPDTNLYWLATTYLDGIGPKRLQKWLTHFGHIKNLFTATTADLKAAQLTQQHIEILTTLNWKKIEYDLHWCQQNNCKIINWTEEAYPPLLKQIHAPPPVLFIQGNHTLLTEPQLAIVGTRNPTPTGRQLAETFAYQLNKAGLVITSGMASGIDSASHYGALKATGQTIAICGAGLQYTYPPSNKKLAAEILKKGALVSEFSPSKPPKATYFPIRNRIISGLSLGVLVVEAAVRSGSLITAHFAADQGREVFALPGSVHNPQTRGCHQLINQGAKLIEKEEDILEELKHLKCLFNSHFSQKSPINDNKKNDLLAQIGYEITTFDAIIHRTGLTPSEVSSMLLSLELESYIQSTRGGYVRNLAK